MKTVSILGVTGSIGTQTAEIIEHFPDQFQVYGVSAGRNINTLLPLVKSLKPDVVSIDPLAYSKDIESQIKAQHPTCDVLINPEGMSQIAASETNDIVVVATSGITALQPTIEAIRHNIKIALANKEVLVSAGDLISQCLAENNGEILPIDSEHAAIAQCLRGIDPKRIEKIILTASGGPFLNRPIKSFDSITSKDALKHPKWEMGKKITVDSATMMNKGLEVIEAHHLFHVDYASIQVVVHPESIMHGAVELCDGSIIAELGPADMRLPIQSALFHPDKTHNPWKRINLWEQPKLSFQKPDLNKFPLLKLAYEIGEKGGQGPAIMNAANEAAVRLFLEDKIMFNDIFKIVLDSLNHFISKSTLNIEEIIQLDTEVKQRIVSMHGN